jgi:hypothetical protein
VLREKTVARASRPSTRGECACPNQADPGSPNMYYGRRVKSYGKEERKCGAVARPLGRAYAAVRWTPTLTVGLLPRHVTRGQLLQPKTASDQIGLIAYASQLIAHASEAQRIDCVAVSLQIVRPAGHGFAGLRVFKRDGDAA